jgi:hypothetical protein
VIFLLENFKYVLIKNCTPLYIVGIDHRIFLIKNCRFRCISTYATIHSELYEFGKSETLANVHAIGNLGYYRKVDAWCNDASGAGLGCPDPI